jgi:DNA-binding FrmR family transcriptional regulator
VRGRGRAERLHQLKTTAGHINAIVRMLEDGRPCMDVVQQIRAARSALACVSESLLDDYLHTCMAAFPECDSEERERLFAELKEVFHLPYTV